jgi:hypothetical protein
MKFDLTTILGVTALIIIITVMLRRSEETSRILRGLSDAYVSSVGAFIKPEPA